MNSHSRRTVELTGIFDEKNIEIIFNMVFFAKKVILIL